MRILSFLHKNNDDIDNNSNSNNNNNNNNNDNYDNSPGQRPIGVLDLRYSPGSFWNVPRPRKVGAPGPTAAKAGPTRSRQPPPNLRQGHGDFICARDSFDAITIDF